MNLHMSQFPEKIVLKAACDGITRYNLSANGACIVLKA